MNNLEQQVFKSLEYCKVAFVLFHLLSQCWVRSCQTVARRLCTGCTEVHKDINLYTKSAADNICQCETYSYYSCTHRQVLPMPALRFLLLILGLKLFQENGGCVAQCPTNLACFSSSGVIIRELCTPTTTHCSNGNSKGTYNRHICQQQSTCNRTYRAGTQQDTNATSTINDIWDALGRSEKRCMLRRSKASYQHQEDKRKSTSFSESSLRAHHCELNYNHWRLKAEGRRRQDLYASHSMSPLFHTYASISGTHNQMNTNSALDIELVKAIRLHSLKQRILRSDIRRSVQGNSQLWTMQGSRCRRNLSSVRHCLRSLAMTNQSHRSWLSLVLHSSSNLLLFLRHQ